MLGLIAGTFIITLALLILPSKVAETYKDNQQPKAELNQTIEKQP